MGQVIDIGFYKNESDWSDVDMENVKKHEGMAHEVNYVEGSKCDLTNRPRRATAKVSLSGHPACYMLCVHVYYVLSAYHQQINLFPYHHSPMKLDLVFSKVHT